MKMPEPIPAGSLLIITTDEYSSYYVMGVFRAKQTIDHANLYKEYLKEYPEQAHPPGSPYMDEIVGWNFRPDKFLAWVSRKGLLEPLDCYEWNLELAKIERVEDLSGG
jgi:hypothetical protein